MVEQPPPYDGPFPRGRRTALAPHPRAFGGAAKIVRSGFLAKYDPIHPGRGKIFDETDPFWEFPWSDPKDALDGPWVVPNHRGVQALADRGAIRAGDLVFLMRTRGTPSDAASYPWLNRRTIVGVCWAESVTTDDPEWSGAAVTLFPMRRFDFPVPIKQTAELDASFGAVDAFSDQAQRGFLELDLDELLAVARSCGLPVDVLTEPDPNRLAPLLQGLDLGPPDQVRRRILDGARAQDHRDRVERAAVHHVVRQARKRRYGVADTQKIRGADGPGADLWLNAIEGDGTLRSVRIEVKGTAASNWRQVRVTVNELKAAKNPVAGIDWWLVVITDALTVKVSETWLSADEVVAVFTKHNHTETTFSPDAQVARELGMI